MRGEVPSEVMRAAAAEMDAKKAQSPDVAMPEAPPAPVDQRQTAYDLVQELRSDLKDKNRETEEFQTPLGSAKVRAHRISTDVFVYPDNGESEYQIEVDLVGDVRRATEIIYAEKGPSTYIPLENSRVLEMLKVVAEAKKEHFGTH